MKILSHEIVSSGQMGAYKDSQTIIHMTTTPGTEDEAWEVSKSIHKVEIQEENSRQFNGSCSFPHGLNSFGKVRQLDPDGTKWAVEIIRPYCD